MNDLVVAPKNISVAAKIRLATKNSSKADARWLEEMEAHKREYKEREAQANTEMFPYLRRCHASLYSEWLRGHLNGGGHITHVYNRNHGGAWFAHSDFTVTPLYGAQSVSIIVPAGINVATPNGAGHINIYYMDGFSVNSNFVPLYDDVKQQLVR